MPEINITYDLLFDILRIEKSREDLQKLDDKFYQNIVEYIKIKESVINSQGATSSEKELTRIQLNNIRKLLTELYDRREKKIISLAIYKIKSRSSSINIDALLSEEKSLFDEIYKKLLSFRDALIIRVLEAKDPVELIFSESSKTGSNNASANSKESSEILDNSTGVKSIRFTRAVPKFLGTELEQYGPFEENDIASLPSRIANILIRKSRAEEIRIS